MKPSFALTLDQDSIGLLHRTPQGWLPVGSVAFSDPDMETALQQLCRTAQGLEPQGFTTKLVIPNSEIRYMTLRAPGPKAAQRRAQIAAALDGTTPYALDELVFDWSGTGEDVQVAVVARETLAEAEGFAHANGFRPVSLVALPDVGAFAAEPWFGLTSMAGDLMGPGEKLVRDQDPIRLVTRKDPSTRKAAAAIPDAAATPAEAADPEPLPEPVLEPAAAVSDDTLVPAPETEPPAATPPDATAGSAPAEEGPAPEAMAEPVAAEPPPAAAPAAVAEPEPALVPAATPALEPEPESVTPPLQPDPVPVTAAETVSPPEPVAEAPAVAVDARPAPVAPASAGPVLTAELPSADAESVVAPVATEAAPPVRTTTAKTPAAVAGLDDGDLTQSWPGEDDPASLSRTQAALAASLAPVPDPADTALAAGIRRDLGVPTDDLPPMPPGAVLRASAQARTEKGQTPPAVARLMAGNGLKPPAPSAAAGAASERLSDKVQKALGKAAKSAKVKAKPAVQRPAGAPPPPPLPPSATQPQVPQPKSEAEAMTVFGQRRGKVGGKPRFLGLVLTGVLLLLLALVAVWAAMFLEPPRDEAAVTPPAGTATPVATAADSTGTAPPAAEPQDEAAVPAEAVEEAVQPSAEAVAETDPAPEVPAEPVAAADPAPAPVPETAPTGAADGRAVGEATRSLVQGVADELTLPLPDPALGAAAPARLAAAEVVPGGEAPPAPPAVLPGFGALYQFDADGNILPTAEGVITPDGVRLVAARPARLPPARPGDLAPAALAPAEPATPEAPVTAAPETTVTAAPVVVPETPVAEPVTPVAEPVIEAFEPDRRFAGNRPRGRPEGLAPPPTAPPAEAAPEAPVADEGALPTQAEAPSAFAARRPAVRPAALAAAATRAAEAEQARRLSEAAAAAAAAASTTALQQASADLASGLAATRRPPARPADFNRAVEAAVAAAVAPPPPTTRRQAEPEPEPERTAAAAPSRRDRTSMGARTDDFLEDNEPDISGPAPNIPTRASVARQATVAGALNLGRTNLIGVFGTANARYALVRESGGRLVRVKVGDRVDGGRVVAIGNGELSYQRGGETVRLRMPRG